MEYLEAGIKFVKQGFAGAIKMIGHMQRTRGQSTKYLKIEYQQFVLGIKKHWSIEI